MSTPKQPDTETMTSASQPKRRRRVTVHQFFPGEQKMLCGVVITPRDHCPPGRIERGEVIAVRCAACEVEYLEALFGCTP